MVNPGPNSLMLHQYTWCTSEGIAIITSSKANTGDDTDRLQASGNLEGINRQQSGLFRVTDDLW